MSLAEKSLHILKAVDDPLYFVTCPYFLNITPYPKQAEIFQAFYKANVQELILVVGRGGGKTTLAAMFALYEIFKLLILPDPAKHFGLIPGSLIFVITVAVSEEQAHDTIYSRIIALMRNSPYFKDMNPKVFKNEIHFPGKNIHIMCGHSSSTSLVGRDVKVAIFEEIAKYEESTSKRGAWNIYNSVKQSAISRFKDKATIISISSPRHENDIAMTLYAMSKHAKSMLGFKYTTWEFNPKITFEDLRSEMEKDPVAFWTDYGSEPMESVSPYMPEDMITVDSGIPNYLKMIAEGRPVNIEKGLYVLTGDPAQRHDSFGIALGRKDGDKIICCGTYRFTPKLTIDRKAVSINPVDVKDFFLRVINTVKRVHMAVFDTWSYPLLQDEIRQKGVIVENYILKREDFDNFKDMCFHDKFVMCSDPIAVQEFKQLKLINNRKVDHPTGGSKDVADAIVQLVRVLTTQKQSYPLNIIASFR